MSEPSMIERMAYLADCRERYLEGEGLTTEYDVDHAAEAYIEALEAEAIRVGMLLPLQPPVQPAFDEKDGAGFICGRCEQQRRGMTVSLDHFWLCRMGMGEE